jgi:hypothetical protein
MAWAVILDGLQRCELKKRAEGDSALVTCWTWSCLTLEEEARLFLLLNDTPRPLGLFGFMER